MSTDLYSFSAASNELVLRLGNRRDDGFSTRVGNWLDAAQLRLCKSLIDFPDLEETITFTATDGQPEYTLSTIIPPTTNIVGIRWVSRVAGDQPAFRLIRFPWVEYRSLSSQASSTPVRWARYGNTIALDPEPDDSYEIRIEYRRQPRLGVTEIPNEWQEDWLALAEHFAWRALLVPDRAQMALEMMTDRIQALVQAPLDQDQWESAWDVDQGIRPMNWGY